MHMSQIWVSTRPVSQQARNPVTSYHMIHKAPRVAHKGVPRFITLPGKLAEAAGIYPPSDGDGMRMFLRKRCLIKYDVTERGATGFIQGSPGTGKSLSTLYAAACLASFAKWNVVWIHLVYTLQFLTECKFVIMRIDRTMVSFTIQPNDFRIFAVTL